MVEDNRKAQERFFKAFDRTEIAKAIRELFRLNINAQVPPELTRRALLTYMDMRDNTMSFEALMNKLITASRLSSQSSQEIEQRPRQREMPITYDLVFNGKIYSYATEAQRERARSYLTNLYRDMPPLEPASDDEATIPDVGLRRGGVVRLNRSKKILYR